VTDAPIGGRIVFDIALELNLLWVDDLAETEPPVIITDDRCPVCKHFLQHHEVEDDNIYCLGNLYENSTVLPGQIPPPCSCTRNPNINN